MNDQNYEQIDLDKSDSNIYGINLTQMTEADEPREIKSKESVIGVYKSTFMKSEVSYQDRQSIKAKQSEIAQQRKTSWKKKLQEPKSIIILVSIFTLLLLLIILCTTLIGSSSSSDPVNPSPDPPSPTPQKPVITANPYSLSQQGPQISYDGFEYTIYRNESTEQKKDGVTLAPNNQFIDSVTVQTVALSYNTMRTRFFDAANPPEEKQLFLSPEYQKNYNQGLKFEIPVTVGNCSHREETAFFFTINDQSGKNQLLTTAEQNFIMMTQYQEIGFKVYSRRIYGIGERFTDFLLNEGNYTMYPYFDSYVYDNGIGGGKEQYGQHPFILVQSNNSDFFGIYLHNANAQTITINHLDTNNASINFIITGGILDVFYFTGPSYLNVIQQYQQMIGFPKLIPQWANGFFTRSVAYTKEQNLDTALIAYQRAGIPLDGWSLPVQSLVDMQNFQYTFNIQMITSKFGQYSQILPYTYFVTGDSQQQALLSQNLAVTIGTDSQNLQVMLNSLTGYCMDVFNPEFVEAFLRGQFEQANQVTQGFWLDRNMPYITDVYNAPEDNAENDPFYGLSYIPGYPTKGNLTNGTLPIYSLHQTSATSTDYHYNLHGLYGTQFSVSVLQALNSSQAFVLSDSTFPGAGQYGIAHVLPQNKASWQDLILSVTNIINFNLFGIPNVGTSLGGYYPTTDQELFVRYFQLAVVSPIAIYNDGNTDLSYHPFNLNIGNLQNVQRLLIERLAMFSYIRTELFRMSKFGGTLVRPMLSQFPTNTNINPADVSAVMFGCCIKVDFQFSQGAMYKSSYFPGNIWVNLNTMVPFRVSSQRLDLYTPLNTVNRFQMEGTIIGIQDNVFHNYDNVKRIKDLSSVPIIVSVLLDNNGLAEGDILFEDDTNQEYYHIQAKGSLLSFKQQNNGSIGEQANKNIGALFVTNVQQPIYTACALHNDMQTIQQLYVYSYSETSKQAVIMPRQSWDEDDQTTISISDIAYIFMGPLTVSPGVKVCNSTLFSLQITGAAKAGDNTYVVTAIQNLYKIMGESIPLVISINITLLSDNSIYMNFNSELGDTPQIIERDFSKQKPSGDFVLTDFLALKSGESTFELIFHNPNDKDEIYFTTKDAIIILHPDVNIINFHYPMSNKDRFFGWGERKGDFYLADKTKYSLFSNGNDVQDQMQHAGRVVQFGKNGYFPIMYNQFLASTNYTALLSLSASGGDYIFDKNAEDTDLGPRSTIISSLGQDFVFLFNLSATDIVKAIQDHIEIGDILSPQVLQVNLPPPEWMFGLYSLMDDIQSLDDLQSTVDAYKNCPLEGFVMSQDNLEEYQSLTFNTTQFDNIEATLTYMDTNNMTFIQIQNPGINLKPESESAQSIINSQTYVKTPTAPDEPVVGQDQQGSVVYVDYSSQSRASIFSNDQIEEFQTSYSISRVGVQLLKNEITNLYCSGDCIKQDLAQQIATLFSRVGTYQTLQNMLSYSSIRQLGTDQYLHNLNGLLQQVSFANAFQGEKRNLPLISQSNTIGSGQLGNVGRVMDYLGFSNSDAQIGVMNLQSLSIMGMPLIGESLNMNNIPLDTTDASLQSTFLIYFKLLAFSPLSFHSLQKPVSAQQNTLLQLKERLLQGASAASINSYIGDYARWKYSLIKYSRTQVFQQTVKGEAFIRPMFFDFPSDNDTYSLVDTQLMYGPSLQVSFSSNPSQEDPIYLPEGLWCTSAYETPSSKCTYYSTGTLEQSPLSYVYLRQNSIIPLQQIPTSLKNSFDLQSIPLDLHLVFDFNSTQLSAHGFILVDSPQSDSSLDFCYLSLDFLGQTLTITDISQNYGGNGNCTYNDKNNGFVVGKIYIYNPKDISPSFANALVNGIDPIYMTTGPNQQYFDVTILNLKINQIQTVEFNFST